MRVKTLKTAVVYLFVGMCCSNVIALNLMGPPNAELEKGQWELGAEYTHSEFALDFDFTSGSIPNPDFTKDEMKMDLISGRVGYGITETIEGFARIGSASIENKEDGEDFSGDGIVYGVGGKVTLAQQQKIKWGVHAQINWINDVDGEWTGPGWAGDAETNLIQVLVSAGPNYQLTDYLSLYGGPFFYYLDGEKEYTETTPTPGEYEKYDLSNPSEFGGYIGAQIDLPENFNLTVEYQFTGDDNILGIGLAWKY